MADSPSRGRLDQPIESRGRRIRVPRMDPEAFGRGSEAFARFMGTPQFLIYMTVFVAVWLAWNTWMPIERQFDPRELNYTLLTLILSLQASYAAPLILLAQNRQDDRDRVGLEQDRTRDERNLADTEFLTREVAALRIALRDVATRDFVRSELRDLLEEMEDRRDQEDEYSEPDRRPRKKKKQKHKASLSPASDSAAPRERARRGDTQGDVPRPGSRIGHPALVRDGSPPPPGPDTTAAVADPGEGEHPSPDDVEPGIS